jgi:methylenetetrahydrofolate--tRNA-(uracil-5-)-methyltransferase
MNIKVIGAGLAGCEAAWQIASRGIPVTLYDMKPGKMSPAHHSPLMAELVCSNSLRSDRMQNAAGLLKEEMRVMGSLILRAADKARVPAGGALAVDRELFSGYITNALGTHPLVTVMEEELTCVPDAPAVIATGPLTADTLAAAIAAMPGVTTLGFYDAAAPVVTAASLDRSKVFRASRYDRGDDYLNCPMNREEYDAFVLALLSARTAPVHGFEESAVFEGCMPVESMARRGQMALAYGPMKPVGLVDPRTGRQAYAVVQLRQDDAAASLYNLVGFQTRLMFDEQKRVFGMIPGLENAEFARLGVMHRNTFLKSPGMLDNTYRMIANPGMYFAGQITGVEGYIESAASGLTAGIALVRALAGEKTVFPRATAIGALANYISAFNRNFQPMNISFGLMDAPAESVSGKTRRAEVLTQRAIQVIKTMAAEIGIPACREQ